MSYTEQGPDAQGHSSQSTEAPRATTDTTPKAEVDDSKPKKLVPKCLYRVEYRDQDDILISQKEGNSAAEVKSPQRLDEPVMEVITTISVRRKPRPNNDNFDPEKERGMDNGTEVKINSPLLINALRAVVSYSPGLSLFEEPLTIQEPYQLLIHHRKDLETYKDKHPTNHTPEYREECNQHIDVILEFLRQRFRDSLEKEETRHKQDPPKCTFEYLWTLFKPGVDIYTRSNIEPLASPYLVFVVSSIEGGRSQYSIGPYTVNAWNLESNGEYLVRCGSSAAILPFDGEKDVRSLAAYPLSFMSEDERNALEQRLIERGKRYYDYTQISHKRFHGYTMTTPRRLVSVESLLPDLILTCLYF